MPSEQGVPWLLTRSVLGGFFLLEAQVVMIFFFFFRVTLCGLYFLYASSIINMILLHCFHIALDVVHLIDMWEAGVVGSVSPPTFLRLLPSSPSHGRHDVLQYTPTRVLSQQEDLQRNYRTPG
ncbi:hypothetical protein ARMGADRAFT_87969 [Armillaria gallica]|uniref:Uncharacterized protein n=1 Tax=Armillaria gallica TaxID=47427 RepID=A0A2H3CXY8_ARMGA|nr:hypothetical protein ARMGADRAFT_87969 [Armillaria gallica]